MNDDQPLGVASADLEIVLSREPDPRAELVSLRAELANRTLEVEELRAIAAGARAEAAAQRTAFVRARQEAETAFVQARQEAEEADRAVRTMRGEVTVLDDALSRARQASLHTPQIPPAIVQWFNRFVLKKKPIMLADRARDAGEWAVAAHYYRTALDRNPDRPEIWIQYGHVLKEADRLPSAEAAYRRAIAGAPTLAEPYRHLGDVLRAQRERDDAATAYLQAHSLDPASPDALSGLRMLGWSENDLAALDHLGTEPNPSARPAEPVSATVRPVSSGRAAQRTPAKTGIALVSANFGGIDAINRFPPVPGVDTFFYTDAEALAAADPEAAASWGRIIVPDYPRHDFAPRLDSSVQFRDASILLREAERLGPLGPHQRLALVPHPERNTVREEYEYILQEIANDRPYGEYFRVRYAEEKMTEQMAFFADRGWSLDATLWCGTVWLIENNEAIARCWDGWWDQNLRYGMQDQLSLPVMLDAFGLEPQALPLHVEKNEYWERAAHRNLM